MAAEGSIDEMFALVQTGDMDAFAAWYARVARPLRGSLRSFARDVDVEAVVQEAMIAMWRIARTLTLRGEEASLRYALRVARTRALMEVRKQRGLRREEIESLEWREEGQVNLDPPPDPGLRRAIEECLEKLAGRPRKAILARLRSLGEPDSAGAAALRMTLNTFRQNIVRARRALRTCLDARGVSLKGIA